MRRGGVQDVSMMATLVAVALAGLQHHIVNELALGIRGQSGPQLAIAIILRQV